ncbi:HD domain-containing phosphohydrolase [Thiorhodovibrio frisius]|uniref:PAS domain S-box n=1 Tax=Thiorhodovibrio frisius TaxID=631362 RepID=H8Z4S7_9GAMM|nr:HD domain-containing phosphohydrolase [Thiorhodovibrio frisius]EIC20334.1 PAS domain S-box [Thiorhodovibrio frisius]WPL21072.1 Cyclic di-GMP phosphodiesterase response regulator RpfG [Thiorhodovibrio frisius]
MPPAIAAAGSKPTHSDPAISRQALVEQLRTWESIVSRLPEAVCITDGRGIIEYVNAAFEQLFGYPAADLLDGNLGVLDLPESHDTDTCALPGFDHKGSLPPRDTVESWQGDVVARHRDGQAIPVRVSTLPRRTETDHAQGFVSIFVDISETKRRERQLDEIIHRNPDAILITDDSGCVRFANPAAQRLLARDGRELEDFPLGLTSQSGGGEIDVQRPSGELVPVELHAMETTWENQRAHVLTLRDLTDRHLAEQEKLASAERIRTALVQTIEAISRTVETRDPYTAGHQRRVATLGREMALALGLDQHMVDGVYMGGTIHDIGKLYIPAEILNRPGKLNDAEFMLIKTHCSVGRDIIAGIEFPWPLAEMIHQHHERIDGTGYPRGLRGEEILLQARILSIADVVDAMSSRRPYREAMGLDAALKEIARGAGTIYDPEAADVCIQLFKSHGLRLEDLEPAT